ncbi:MAG: hypothetical protein CTY12_07695 [Methylotenera sp.]|nr:MAG: hypothetical protein CTY12_07695 [Methylotenera sp.]
MLNRFYTQITSPTLSLTFVGLMFFLPFVYLIHRNPIPTFYGEWLAGLLGLIACLALLVKSNLEEIRIPQISLIFLGLSSILGMQWLLGMLHSHQHALLILSYLVWAFLLMILGSYLKKELGWEKIVNTLAWFLVFGGIVNVIFVSLQLALNSGVNIPYMLKYPSYGTLAQANNNADYFALATTSLMYLFAKKQLNLKWFGLGLALFISLLAFSGSRSTYLYLGALTILAVGLQVKAIRQQTGSPQIRSLVRTSLLLIPLFVFIQWLLQNSLPDALINLPNERLEDGMSATTGSARFQIWFDSWRLAIQSPWLGIGTGQMRWQSFMLLDSPTPNSFKKVFEHAHNLFLHLFTEMGILAVVITLAGIVAWMRAFKWRELNLETWWVIAVLAIIGIHSMLEYPLWYAYFLGVTTFLLGAGEEKFTNIKLLGSKKIILTSLFAFIFVAAGANLSTLAIANYKLEKNMMDGLEGKLTKYELYAKDMLWARDYSLLSPYAEAMLAVGMTPNKSIVNDQILLSEKVMRFMPYKQTAYNHVLLLETKGDRAGAIKQLNRSLLAHPVKKITKLLEPIPREYWSMYLEVLNEVRPLKKIPKEDYKPLQRMKREEQQKQAQEK